MPEWMNADRDEGDQDDVTSGSIWSGPAGCVVEWEGLRTLDDKPATGRKGHSGYSAEQDTFKPDVRHRG